MAVSATVARSSTRWSLSGLELGRNGGETIEEIRDLGSRVCVVTTQRGRGKGSGIEVEDRYVVLYEMEGDKIGSMTLYATTAEAVEAAGLRE
jgi:ketosteroid isomerase-like protein